MADLPWAHAAEARAALNAIVSDPEHGVAALSSPQMMSNLLKDYLPDAPREKSIMVAAAEAGLANTLREHVANGMDPTTATRLAASSFSASTPFTPEACSWVAGEFAVALGLARDTPAGSAQATRPGFPSPAASPGAVTQLPGAFEVGGGQAPGSQQQPGPGFPQSPAGFGQQPGQGYQQQAGGFPAQQPGQGSQQGTGYQPTQALPPAGGYQQGAAPGGGIPGAPGGYQQGVPGAPGGPAGYQQGMPGAPGGPAGYQQGMPGAPGGYGYQGAARPGYSPSNWPPGSGYPPAGGVGGPGGPPRRKRGLWIGGGVVVVLIIVVVAVMALASPGSKKNNPPPSSSVSSSASASTSPSPTPSASVESLTQLLTTVGNNCGSGTLAGLTASTLTSYKTCNSSVSTITVYGWQFDNHADYLKGLSHLRNYTGFYDATAGSSCPPSGSSKVGDTQWYSNTDSRFPKSATGLVFDCYTDHLNTNGTNNQSTYLWTFPMDNIILLAQNPEASGGFPTLDKWWSQLSYG